MEQPFDSDASGANPRDLGVQQIAGAVPAAVVAFQPDHLFADLVSTLDHDHRRIFIFLNGGVSPDIETRLSALSNGHIIRSADNVGLGEGLNVLAAAAAREGQTHLQLFDQDSSPEPELPSALARCFNDALSDNPRLAVVAPRLTPPTGENFQKIRVAWRNRFRRTVDFAPTSGSILALSAWKDVGPFRSDYFIDGIDVEWCLRAWHNGWSSLVFEEHSMVHRWGTAVPPAEAWKSQILRQPEQRVYFYVRNAVNIARTAFAPILWRLRFAMHLIAQLAVLLVARARSRSTRQAVRRAVSDGWHGRLGPIPPDLLTAIQ